MNILKKILGSSSQSDKERIAELEAENRELKQIIESLQNQVKVLESKISKLLKNSSNSSKPPSSDDITKPKKKKSSKKQKDKKRKIGGQPGHKKHERKPFEPDEIDELHKYFYTECPVCNSDDIVLHLDKTKTMQQVDINEFPVEKSEHVSFAVWCNKCEAFHYMPIPPEVIREGLFKARLTALVAYMKHVDHASYSTIRKFLRDVLKVTVSRGYLRKIVNKVSDSLEGTYLELLNRLPFETAINVDETGHKENGEKFWTWVFRTDLYVLFKIDKSRGSKVLIEVLGKEFDGVLGCDYFSAYRKYMNDFSVTVQFCIAHLIRDIRFLIGLKDAETKAYGKKLLENYRKLFKIIHNQENMSPEAFKQGLEKAKQDILTVALEPPSSLDKFGKETKNEAQNMANRFRKHGDAYFEFITSPQIDPTNNLAEQAVRFVVIDRYITQGTRSENGRTSCERIWTVVSTCSLQGHSAYDFILKAVNAYFHNEPAPSLLQCPP